MTWAFAGAAAISTATALYSSNSAAKNQAKSASSASKAEGEAIAKERVNTTIRNSYQAALGQMQLALQKRQLSTQSTEIRAATLAAQGDANLANAATGSIGASTQAITSDIEQKSQAALDQTSDAFENAMENYQNDLNLMVLNTDQSAPNVRKFEYTGPSGGEMLGQAVIGGLAQFASGYAMRKMSLGLGSAPSGQVGAISGGMNARVSFG